MRHNPDDDAQEPVAEANGGSEPLVLRVERDASKKAGEPERQEDKGGFREWIRSPKHKLLLAAVAIGLVAAAVYGIRWWLESRKWQATANAYVQGAVAQLSPAVPGHVVEVYVADNALVRAGQPILKISQSSYDARVQRAVAELARARGQLAQARAAVPAAAAQTAEARTAIGARAAEARRAQADLGRLQTLSEAAVAETQIDQSQAQLVAARAAEAAARDRVDALEAQADQARANVEAAEAAVKAAEANLADARIALDDTTLEASMTGRLTNFDIEPGDYVQPGRPIASLVGLERWVEANFKESQLTLMRPGQFAEITIDAFPETPLAARVESFQAGTGSEFSVLPSQNATGNWIEVTQRVPVRIAFRPGALEKLPAGAPVVPGLSVDARVKVRADD